MSEATATSMVSSNQDEEDDLILKDMWNDCFIGKMISSDIFATINESNGRNRAKTKVAS